MQSDEDQLGTKMKSYKSEEEWFDPWGRAFIGENKIWKKPVKQYESHHNHIIPPSTMFIAIPFFPIIHLSTTLQTGSRTAKYNGNPGFS